MMPPPVTPEIAEKIDALGVDIAALAERQHELAESAGIVDSAVETAATAMGIFQGYLGVLVAAFVVTLIATPFVRRMAMANGVIDHPDERKVHRMPIAYLGGVAVFLGIMAGIFYSYFASVPELSFLIDYHQTGYVDPQALPLPPDPSDIIDGKIDSAGYDEKYRIPYALPLWVPLGLTAVMLVGLLDDVMGVSPRVKLGGQLIAAAALAYGDFGVKVAQGVLNPTLGKLLNNDGLVFHLATIPDGVPLLGGGPLEFDLIYWSGTVVIAVFVLGCCNAANLIDGLDGLLTGVTSIATVGFLMIALMLALEDNGPRDAQRIVLCMAVLGACLGFLPHNFNPANIFLGDCGSLLLGFCSCVMILSMGDTGRTPLVVAAVIIYAIPIMDTALAIVRRKLAGKRMSEPDSDHLHHMLKRSAGVKGAVLILYGIGLAFMVLGVAMSTTKARFTYALALLFASYIVVYSIKIARKAQHEAQSAEIHARTASAAPEPAPEPSPEPVS